MVTDNELNFAEKVRAWITGTEDSVKKRLEELMTNGQIKWELKDSLGNSHIVIRTYDEYWFGIENVQVKHPLTGDGKYFMPAVKRHMEENPDMGETMGCSWVRV